MNITKDEIKLLQSCQDSFEWNEACKTIVSARDYDDFPPDWKRVVLDSGFMNQIRARWDAKSKRMQDRMDITDLQNFADGKVEDGE